MYKTKFRGLEFKIYQTKQKTWKSYFRYAGKPHQIHKTKEKDAIESTKELIDKLCDYGEVKGTLTRSEDELYHSACKILEPFNISVLEAAQFYAKAHAGIVSSVTVYEASQAFLKAKHEDKLSDVYVDTLQKHLRKICEQFALLKMIEVKTYEIDNWLRSLKCSPRTRNNIRNTMITLWKWAMSQSFIPYGKTAPELTSVAKEPKNEVELLSPEQMSKMLKLAKDEGLDRIILYLALGGFAGIRTAEIERLTWENIHIDNHQISIGADKAKTASRRIVPISDNLLKWLKLVYKKGFSGDLKCKGASKYVGPMARVCGFKWSPNLLRHSYISYRVAQTQDVAKVSLEAGNSPSKIFSNYRGVSLPDKRLVTDKLSEKWFSIVP